MIVSGLVYGTIFLNLQIIDYSLQATPHILFICSWYPHLNNLTSGIFIKRHAECIALTHKVTVVFAKSSSSVSKEQLTITETGNLTEIILLYPKIQSNIPVWSAFLKYKVYQKQLLNCVKKAQQLQPIDIIHLNSIFPACIPTLRLLKHLKCPLFITEHWTGYAPEDGRYKGFIMKYFTKKIISKAHTIIAISEYLKQMMESHRLYGNYQVVPNVIDINLFTPVQRHINDNTSFIHISSLDDEQKNVSGIIKSFTNAIQKNPHLTLTIVGKGTSLVTLKDLVEIFNLQASITFLGSLMGQKLVEEINKHDALVMFSNYETFCLVVPEVFACGKPVITSCVGGIADYMNSELGISVEPKNEEQLTNAFITFANTKQKYQSSAIRNFTVTHFSNDVVNKQFSHLYQLALA